MAISSYHIRTALGVHVPGAVDPGELDIQLPDAFHVGQWGQIDVVVKPNRLVVDIKQ